MKRRLKKSVRRALNVSRKMVSMTLGAAAFTAFFVSRQLPGMSIVYADYAERPENEILETARRTTLCSRDLEVQPFFAHRGFSSAALENSLQAVSEARDSGYPQVELDVHLSKDSVLYVLHDDTLDRTTDSKGKISDRTSAELDQISLRNGEKLPRLSEILDSFQDSVSYLIELKDGQKAVEAYTDLLNRHESLQKHIWTQAWDIQTLEKVRENLPYMYTMLLLPDLSLFFDALDSGAVDGLAISEGSVSGEIISAAHKKNRKVWAWTVDSSSRMESLFSAGVDGIISNHPDMVMSVYSGQQNS